jgi:hypothetical protein
MTYRDDEAALHRREALVRTIRTTSSEAERDALEAELAALDRAHRAEARRRLPLIAQARIASPCHEAFEAMDGEGAIRHCGRCDHEVFDLVQMTLAQAEALIASRAGGKTCARLHRRSDGTLMFADCEVGAQGIRARRIGLAVAGAILGASAIAAAHAPSHAMTPHTQAPTAHAPSGLHGVHYVHDPSAPPQIEAVMGQMIAAPPVPSAPFSLGPSRMRGVGS